MRGQLVGLFGDCLLYTSGIAGLGGVHDPLDAGLGGVVEHGAVVHVGELLGQSGESVVTGGDVGAVLTGCLLYTSPSSLISPA